jgi:hypothetical protein
MAQTLVEVGNNLAPVGARAAVAVATVSARHDGVPLEGGLNRLAVANSGHLVLQRCSCGDNLRVCELRLPPLPFLRFIGRTMRGANVCA